LLVCVTMVTGCQGLQYLGVMATPLQLSRKNASTVGAFSLVIANVVKFAASFAVCYVAQLVSHALIAHSSTAPGLAAIGKCSLAIQARL